MRRVQVGLDSVNRSTPRRVVLGVVGAALLVVLNTAVAFAAMDATLSSDHARAGDRVLLLSDDHHGVGTYEGLSSENHQKIYLGATTIQASADGCRGTALVGQLEWRGNAGGLSFTVPPLAAADYWIFMGTSGQCWRLGEGDARTHHILVLTVGSVPADNQDMAWRWTPDQLGPASPIPVPVKASPDVQHSPQGVTPWPLIVLFGLGVLLALTIAFAATRALAPGLRARHNRLHED